MGTQPEEIEHALRGKRTLPRPEGEPRKLEDTKASSPSPEAQQAEQAAEGARRELRGERGRMLTEDEEKRSAIRGGRWNAASKDDRV